MDPLADDSAAPPPRRGGRGTSGLAEQYDLGTIAASVVVVPYGATIHGWAILESTGAAVAKVRIRDGRDTQGAVVAPIGLAAGASSIIYAAELGIRCDTGVYLEVVSGSVEAVLYLVAP